ncbi:GPI ethanolamine phosphate transferase 1-like [Mya arenaria]|uniref:GPI ethanolamine phosphate transferase 1-like n=1 Tax=Mya arenaria TaxID=6604 RepID=UPI0022E85990|nr:GPI ethanolamine phosphate transferase 1-like [Mya arenaria]
MRTWQVLVVGIVIHTIFFYSIFDIYFTSPVVHGMTPHHSTTPPLAKRLVLFSADGLRADKMFELDKDGNTRIPYLRSMIEKSGSWGVSHTRVPTESRPGHVALIAGFYEDVSAVAKGWKENPVEFDSLFNESRYTWSWGSPDILPMFSKGATGDHVFTKCYPAHFEDFARGDSSGLDTWVFDEFQEFMRDSMKDPDMTARLNKDKVVFFLHLLGLDTNGHSMKPHSDEYLENIRLVDAGIQQVVETIEEFYEQDGRTAYVMSSDHGMTDWGSHGAGHPSETLTPLVVWGSGVKGARRSKDQHFKDNFSHDWKLDHIERVDVEQGDIASLMAALIGVNFPMNSVGVLPYQYLDASSGDLAEIMYANTRQLLEQYKVKMDLKKSTTLSAAFRPFPELTPAKLIESHRHIRQLIQSGHYEEAVEDCVRIMRVALKGLNYYQTYDRLFLGVSVCCGFLGWMAYTLMLVFEQHSGVVKRSSWKQESHDALVIVVFGCIGVIVAVLLYVQSLPWTNYLYCLIPVTLWMAVVLRRDVLVQVIDYTITMKNRTSFLVAVLASLVGLEILVIGFFFREMLSVGLALIAILPWISLDLPALPAKGQLLGWSFCCMLLAIFPMLPVVTGKRSTEYVLAGGAIVILIGVISGFRSKSSSSDVKPARKKEDDSSMLPYVQLIGVLVATYFSVWEVNSGLSPWQQGVSWLLLGVSVLEPLLTSSHVSTRLQAIFLAFAAPYILLSVSYEVLFLVVLGLTMHQWLQVEFGLVSWASKTLTGVDVYDFQERANLHLPGHMHSRNYLVISDIQRAFYFIFFILTSFFGVGNIASINSFDPAAVLCYISVFSPFTMGALLLFKIVIPFILVTCTLRAVHVISCVPVDGLFLIIMLMSDCMALHFFFLVQDYGSWLDIGTSISHYVIVMCMIIFTMVLFGVTHFLTTTNLLSPRRKRRVE